MKPIWDKYSVAVSELMSMIEEFGEGLTEARFQKAFRKIVIASEKVVEQHNAIDKMIDPIAAIDVKMPFESKEFMDMWNIYKEYMIESHNYVIKSRQETILLSRLKRLSDNNQNRAIMMLELFISSGYKSIFKPSEKQLTGDEPTKPEEQATGLDLSKKEKL